MKEILNYKFEHDPSGRKCQIIIENNHYDLTICHKNNDDKKIYGGTKKTEYELENVNKNDIINIFIGNALYKKNNKICDYMDKLEIHYLVTWTETKSNSRHDEPEIKSFT
jgi:hypothetical protein